MSVILRTVTQKFCLGAAPRLIPATGYSGRGKDSPSVFVDALMARYGAGRVNTAAGGRIFRRLRTSTVAQHNYYSSQFRFAPRLAITVASWASTPGQGSDWQPSLHSVRRIVYERSEQHDLFRSVQRLVERSERLEVMNRQAAPNGQRELQPASRIVQRLSSPPPEAEPQPAPAARGSRITAATSEVRQATTVPVNSMELMRLTDQVIQTIDQRIVAQRERLGKV